MCYLLSSLCSRQISAIFYQQEGNTVVDRSRTSSLCGLQLLCASWCFLQNLVQNGPRFIFNSITENKRGIQLIAASQGKSLSALTATRAAYSSSAPSPGNHSLVRDEMGDEERGISGLIFLVSRIQLTSNHWLGFGKFHNLKNALLEDFFVILVDDFTLVIVSTSCQGIGYLPFYLANTSFNASNTLKRPTHTYFALFTCLHWNYVLQILFYLLDYTMFFAWFKKKLNAIEYF